VSVSPAFYVGLGPVTLSPRHWEVLREVATGATYTVIGARLGTSEQTVKNQMQEVRRRLDVSSTIEVYVVLGWLRVP
jgi:DNA-binding NarL/FixJ family response regulator